MTADHMQTTIHLAALQAADSFGGNDGVFNLAGFSRCLSRIAGLKSQTLDGDLCRAILWGQPGITRMYGGSHFRIDKGEEP